MELDDTDQHSQDFSGYDEITGWNSTRPNPNQEKEQVFTGRQCLTFKKNVICSVPSKTLGFDLQKRQRNPDMINYLKSLLTRLQSPVV